MANEMVRISAQAHETLRKLARAEGKPMQAVLDEALEALRRIRFLEQVNQAYGALRGDPVEWQALQRERKQWEGTLLDGLEVREGQPA